MKKQPGQFRVGKTARDHKRGAWSARLENRDLRNAWLNDSKATQANFPYHTCNGKRNRSLTNKGQPITYICR